MIHWELCKKMTFDYANKEDMHNPELVLENDTHKFLCDFEIQPDQLISAKRPDLVIIIKKNIKKQKQKGTRWIEDFAVLALNRIKLKESEKKDSVPGSC